MVGALPSRSRFPAIAGVTRYLLIAAAVAAATFALATAEPVQEQTAAAAEPAPIDNAGAAILVRTTLSALNDANRTGNYTVFRDLAAPGFRDANSAARLAEQFADLRGRNLNLAPVAVIAPQFTLPPTIDQRGMLRMAGIFPTRPLQVTFQMLFSRNGDEWRLIGIAVDTPPAPANS